MRPDHVESELTYPVEFAVDYVRVFRRRPLPPAAWRGRAPATPLERQGAAMAAFSRS